MEKISALIDKLQELKNSNAGLQSISYYVQLLQSEILHARNLQREQERAQYRKDSNIAVIMPTAPLSVTATAPITPEVPVTTSAQEKEQVQEVKQPDSIPVQVSVHTSAPASSPMAASEREKVREVKAPVSVTMPAAAPASIPAVTPAAAHVAAQKSAPAPEAIAKPAPVSEPVAATTPEPAKVPASEPAAAPAAASNVLTLPFQNTNMPKPAPAPTQAPAPQEQAPEERKPAFITIYGNAETQHVNTPAGTSEKTGNAERKPETNGTERKPETTAPEKKPETNGVRKELKELNQLVAQATTSLNDRWRQSHTDVADRFSDIPVKDLRQAIGINDKFQFIQELFRGDVDTYERSIKTINELHSLQEAEYWIERELKIRQGWDDENRTVRQFYNLVKKRFS